MALLADIIYILISQTKSLKKPGVHWPQSVGTWFKNSTQMCIDTQTISRFHFIAFIILPGLIIIWLHNCCFWLICSNCVMITYGINMCSCMCDCHGVTVYYNECYNKTQQSHTIYCFLVVMESFKDEWGTSNLLENIHSLLKSVEFYSHELNICSDLQYLNSFQLLMDITAEDLRICWGYIYQEQWSPITGKRY